jgi:hypothetical protein
MNILDLVDRLARFPISYGWQPVKGWPVKHFDTTLSQNSQRTFQNALGEGPWDACESLWTDAFEVPEFTFHPGMGNDAPDIYFPTDSAHPWTSYVAGKAQPGLSDDQLSKLFGIYRTLRTPNYDGNGVLLDSNGNPAAGFSDPREVYFFKPNPANCALDQVIRWGKRQEVIINFPALVNWRDFNDELIQTDDASYTPRSLSLTPTGGGSLTPGQTYYVRVSTIRGADESSASLKTLETKANSITLTAGQTAFQVNWLIKGDEETPAAPPGDITGYRVYLGQVDGVWLGYFTVANPAARTLLITTTAGVTDGNPIDLATSGLLITIKRFECGLFFHPPYDLATILDRLCQISCADWQWSGLGTNTYRNDKIRFMSPADRAPVFTLNLAETGIGSFKSIPMDRRNRSNQIIVNFRDRADKFLQPGQPVILNRELVQEDEGHTKPFTIEAGTVYRSQAQRIASFYARVLCDLDQMASMIGSPKSYHVLPGDVVLVTNNTPNWTDKQFMVRRKDERVEGSQGDPMILQAYIPGLYSDTDYSPIASSLPTSPINPFAEPPVVADIDLTQINQTLASKMPYSVVRGDVQFQDFNEKQIGRIWVKGPNDADFRPAQIGALLPDPITMQGTFEIPVIVGEWEFVVVTESIFGKSKPFGDHPSFSIEVELVRAANVTDIFVGIDGAANHLIAFEGHPTEAEKPETYSVECWNDLFTVKKSTLTLTTGSSHAALLHAEGTGGIIVDEEGGYEGTTVPHTEKNNLYSPPNFLDETPVLGISLDKLVRTFCRFDFTTQYLGPSGTLYQGPIEGGGFNWLAFSFAIGLQPLESVDNLGNIDMDLCPISLRWEMGDVYGTIKEIWSSFGVDISAVGRNNVDPGCLVESTIYRRGPRYTILLSGNEYRGYVDYHPSGGTPPQVIINAPSSGMPFPLRLVIAVGGFTRIMGVKDIMVAGNLSPSTIYSSSQREGDWGLPLPLTSGYVIYQNGPTPDLHGEKVSIIVPTS